MVVYIAGLQAIPRELYEAAEMDGASKWQQFKSITWPFVAPATSIVVAYTTVQSFKAFDLILGIAGNPPKAVPGHPLHPHLQHLRQLGVRLRRRPVDHLHGDDRPGHLAPAPVAPADPEGGMTACSLH